MGQYLVSSLCEFFEFAIGDRERERAEKGERQCRAVSGACKCARRMTNMKLLAPQAIHAILNLLLLTIDTVRDGLIWNLFSVSVAHQLPL